MPEVVDRAAGTRWEEETKEIFVKRRRFYMIRSWPIRNPLQLPLVSLYIPGEPCRVNECSSTTNEHCLQMTMKARSFSWCFMDIRRGGKSFISLRLVLDIAS